MYRAAREIRARKHRVVPGSDVRHPNTALLMTHHEFAQLYPKVLSVPARGRPWCRAQVDTGTNITAEGEDDLYMKCHLTEPKA